MLVLKKFWVSFIILSSCSFICSLALVSPWKILSDGFLKSCTTIFKNSFCCLIFTFNLVLSNIKFDIGCVFLSTLRLYTFDKEGSFYNNSSILSDDSCLNIIYFYGELSLVLDVFSSSGRFNSNSWVISWCVADFILLSYMIIILPIGLLADIFFFIDFFDFKLFPVC